MLTAKKNAPFAKNSWVLLHVVSEYNLKIICDGYAQEFMLDRYEQMVIVDSVVPKSSADQASIKKVGYYYRYILLLFILVYTFKCED